MILPATKGKEGEIKDAAAPSKKEEGEEMEVDAECSSTDSGNILQVKN